MTNGKQLLTLIHDKHVRLPSKAKVIKAPEFSLLLEAQEMNQVVRKDAEQYRQEVVAECEKLKEQARKEGYEEGFVEWAAEVRKLQEEISSVRDEYTKMLAPIALKAAKKIVGHIFETSENIIVDIVSNALRPVTQHKKIAIYVNKEDIKVLDAHREQLKALFEAIEVLTIRERDDITPGGCVIETEGGIINARLENQWALLERAFEQLMQQPRDQKTASTS